MTPSEPQPALPGPGPTPRSADGLATADRLGFALRDAVDSAAHPPAVWCNASTATIYRHSMDMPNTEVDGELGAGFSVDVAPNWEREFFDGELPSTRRVALRMAIVLGDGPTTNLLVRLARLGIGGPQIDGWWFPHRRSGGFVFQHPALDEALRDVASH